MNTGNLVSVLVLTPSRLAALSLYPSEMFARTSRCVESPLDAYNVDSTER